MYHKDLSESEAESDLQPPENSDIEIAGILKLKIADISRKTKPNIFL